jgi:uroporphyrin-3 C-methyltransferase/uroporphyrinogen III methyltransferase/synthase
MGEHEQLPAAGPAATPAPAPGPQAGLAATPLLLDRFAAWRAWWTGTRVLVLALVLALAWNAWSSRSQIDGLREEVAARLKDEDTQAKESRALAREAQDRMREALVKMTALEAKIAESQSQQAALEAMYQDLSRNRDEFALTEIEQTLSIAAQQLQLAGNVRGALLALQNADARLGRADKVQFIAVRRVLQRDIERLKNLPYVDTAGLALRLDAVISSVDTMPLVFDEKLMPQPSRARPGGAEAAGGANGGSAAKAGGGKAAEPGPLQRLRDEAWDQIKQLVRVRDIENAEPVLLSPQQTFFLRENLKLRLLNARISLLQRNEALFREDVNAANAWLSRYFDVRSKSGANAQANLKALAASEVSIELPTLADSLNAVRNFRTPAAPGGK